MPLLRPSPSDYTTVVKALANAGAAVSNPQGSRPASKGSVAFVNVSTVAALIRGSPRLASILPRAVVVAASAPAPAPIVPLTNLGSNDGFVVKYDSAGTPLWVRKVSGTGEDRSISVSVDSSGNVVVVGRYSSNPVTIFAADGATMFTTLANTGGYDAFVVKYNSAGTPQWVRIIGGTGDQDTLSISIDLTGNIIVLGYYWSPVNIYNTDGTTFTTLANAGSSDAFVVKYDSSGTPLWARRIGGTGGDYGNSVSTDSSGNIVVAGVYDSSPLTIFAANGSTAFTLTNAGSQDVFVVKYDSAGTPQWARRMGGTGANDQATSVSTDSSGNIVVCGSYNSNPLTIFAANGATAFTLTNSGGLDAFVVKYDSDGTPQWARRMGGTGDNDTANSVSTDSSGNIVLIGQYASSPLNIFAANGATAFTLTNAGILDVFVVKYDSDGTPQWARRLGGTSNEFGYSVSTDSSGNIVLIGRYTSSSLTIYLANGSTEFATLTNSGSGDAFVVKYDSAGTPLWARRIRGTGEEWSNSVSIDSTGNIVVAGWYDSNPLTIT